MTTMRNVNMRSSVVGVLKQQRLIPRYYHRVMIPTLQDGLNINNQYSTFSAVRFHPLLRDDKFMGIGTVQFTTSTASQNVNSKGESLLTFHAVVT